MTRSRIACSCGARLYEPLPKVCPACGSDIVRVRRNVWRPLLSFLIVALLAAACFAYGLWLLR